MSSLLAILDATWTKNRDGKPHLRARGIGLVVVLDARERRRVDKIIFGPGGEMALVTDGGDRRKTLWIQESEQSQPYRITRFESSTHGDVDWSPVGRTLRPPAPTILGRREVARGLPRAVAQIAPERAAHVDGHHPRIDERSALVTCRAPASSRLRRASDL